MGLLYDYHELLTLRFVKVTRGYEKLQIEGGALNTQPYIALYTIQLAFLPTNWLAAHTAGLTLGVPGHEAETIDILTNDDDPHILGGHKFLYKCYVIGQVVEKHRDVAQPATGVGPIDRLRPDTTVQTHHRETPKVIDRFEQIYDHRPHDVRVKSWFAVIDRLKARLLYGQQT